MDRELGGVITARALAALAIAFCGRSVGATEAHALLACTKAIKIYAVNPSAAKIPYAANLAESGGYFFYWKRGEGLRLQNRLGALNDAEASCIVAVDGAEVLALTIDGVKLIYKPPKK